MNNLELYAAEWLLVYINVNFVIVKANLNYTGLHAVFSLRILRLTHDGHIFYFYILKITILHL